MLIRCDPALHGLRGPREVDLFRSLWGFFRGLFLQSRFAYCLVVEQILGPALIPLKKFFISLIGKHSGLKPVEDGHIYKVDEDKFLKMSGPYGVEGRSVVIHLPGTAKTRLDCANIYPYKD